MEQRLPYRAPLSGKIAHSEQCERATKAGRINVWGPGCAACMYEHGFRDGLSIRAMHDHEHGLPACALCSATGQQMYGDTGERPFCVDRNACDERCKGQPAKRIEGRLDVTLSSHPASSEDNCTQDCNGEACHMTPPCSDIATMPPRAPDVAISQPR